MGAKGDVQNFGRCQAPTAPVLAQALLSEDQARNLKTLEFFLRPKSTKFSPNEGLFLVSLWQISRLSRKGNAVAFKCLASNGHEMYAYY